MQFLMINIFGISNGMLSPTATTYLLNNRIKLNESMISLRVVISKAINCSITLILGHINLRSRLVSLMR